MLPLGFVCFHLCAAISWPSTGRGYLHPVLLLQGNSVLGKDGSLQQSGSFEVSLREESQPSMKQGRKSLKGNFIDIFLNTKMWGLCCLFFFFPLAGLCCKLSHFPRCLTTWGRNIPFPSLKSKKRRLANYESSKNTEATACRWRKHYTAVDCRIKTAPFVPQEE